MKLKLAVVALWAEDVNRTANFYRDVLGLPLLTIDRGRPHFDLGGVFLVILQGRPRGAENAVPPRFPLLAFAVDDLEDAIQQLEAGAVEMPWGMEEEDHSRWITFNDPAGNLLEIVMWKELTPAYSLNFKTCDGPCGAIGTKVGVWRKSPCPGRIGAKDFQNL